MFAEIDDNLLINVNNVVKVVSPEHFDHYEVHLITKEVIKLSPEQFSTFQGYTDRQSLAYETFFKIQESVAQIEAFR
jgi:hypothetical protein